MLLTFRKARKLSPWSLVIGAVVSVACTLIFFTLGGMPLSASANRARRRRRRDGRGRLVPDKSAVHRRRGGAGARQHLVSGGVGAVSDDDAGHGAGRRENTLCGGAGFVSRHGARRRQQSGAAGSVFPRARAGARHHFSHGRDDDECVLHAMRRPTVRQPEILHSLRRGRRGLQSAGNGHRDQAGCSGAASRTVGFGLWQGARDPYCRSRDRRRGIGRGADPDWTEAPAIAAGVFDRDGSARCTACRRGHPASHLVAPPTGSATAAITAVRWESYTNTRYGV